MKYTMIRIFFNIQITFKGDKSIVFIDFLTVYKILVCLGSAQDVRLK